jgi:hypothetical protein
VLLAAFTPCFQARSVAVFEWLVVGWIQCHGRRTLTEVALAADAIGGRHISVFHGFFSRASWTLDALGRVVFRLAVKWAPSDQPLVVLGDDTLARKGGKEPRPGEHAPRPPVEERPRAVRQLRARVGGAGAVGAVAVRQWAGRRPAGAIPSVCQHQARRRAAADRPVTGSRRAAAAGGAHCLCRASADHQVGVAAGDDWPVGAVGQRADRLPGRG